MTLASLGRDERSLETGDWVELIDDTWAPLGTPASLLPVSAINRTDKLVTLRGSVQPDLSLHPFLRRWDQPASGPGDGNGIPITESAAHDGDGWLDLEDGAQIRFLANGAAYQRGDYWLIPARTATGRLLWPGGPYPQAVAPHGPTRFLAPLAVVGTGSTVTDMRTLFTHLAWPDSQAAAGRPPPVRPPPVRPRPVRPPPVRSDVAPAGLEGRAFFEHQQRKRQAAQARLTGRPQQRPLPATSVVSPAGSAVTQPLAVLRASPRLVVISGPQAGEVFDLGPGELILGREEGSAIWLRNPEVSHHHALLRRQGDQVVIEDLRSTNGTMVNGAGISFPTALAGRRDHRRRRPAAPGVRAGVHFPWLRLVHFPWLRLVHFPWPRLVHFPWPRLVHFPWLRLVHFPRLVR